MPVYLRLKGASQGDIKGSVTRKGREGWIEVLDASHSVASPRDAASGAATGKRAHKPFSITKVIDQSSPLLYKALASNESVKEWTLEYSAPEPTGVEKVTYRVKLTDAMIASIDFAIPPIDPYGGKLIEHVGFVFKSIEWTWVPTNTVVQDNWMTP